MDKTAEEILLKLLEENRFEKISDKTIRIETLKGWYDLLFIEESKTENLSYYMLYKSFGYEDNKTGVVFKYQPISQEFMWKHLKGESPKQELINEIFE